MISLDHQGLPCLSIGGTTPEGVLHITVHAEGLKLQYHSYGKIAAEQLVPWEVLDRLRAECARFPNSDGSAG